MERGGRRGSAICTCMKIPRQRGTQSLKCVSSNAEILESVSLLVYLSALAASTQAGLFEFSLGLGLRNQSLTVNHQLVLEKGLLTTYGLH